MKSYPVLTKGFETETEMTIHAIDKNFTLKEIPVLIEYMNTGLVPRFPTLIVACILLVICLLLTMTSIILQVIVKKNKQIFEILLNQIRIMNDKND